MIHLHTARFPEQIEAVRTIFREPADSFGIDLGFQQFDAELASLPGKFAAPRGRVLLASNGAGADPGGIVGCVAMRPIDDTICEQAYLL
ncbi:hypothetical protein OKW41_001788 [Paraburkholderia sp. UCT70]|uniref:hypothetical protein n=1 Tax=Paraburkholderia sp. UCT70 TaxID=2991068 RepID=UPI003D1FA9AD